MSSSPRARRDQPRIGQARAIPPDSPPPRTGRARAAAPAELSRDLDADVPSAPRYSRHRRTTARGWRRARRRGARRSPRGSRWRGRRRRCRRRRRGGLDLHPRRVGGHEDGRRHAEPPGRERDPWAWFPDEKATTPRVRRLIELHQPVGRARNLKLPPCCQALRLIKTRAPPVERRSGVLVTAPSIRLAAARTPFAEGRFSPLKPLERKGIPTLSQEPTPYIARRSPWGTSKPQGCCRQYFPGGP